MAANNGTYRKTGSSGSGSWVKSADRVNVLEERVDLVEEINSAFSHLVSAGAAEPLAMLADANGNVVLQVEEDGGLRLAGMDDTVQATAANVPISRSSSR